MRTMSPALTDLLAARRGHVVRNLLWIRARSWSTGDVESLRLWDGEYDIAVPIDSVSRTYQAAPGVFAVPSIVAQTGLSIRSLRIRFSPISAEMEAAVRLYDVRLAPVQVHRVVIHPDTREVVDLYRLWKGFIDEAPLPTASIDGTSEAELVCVSAARMLTRTLTLRKSDSTQRQRSGDRFRRYVAVSGSISVTWGGGKFVKGVDRK